MPDPVGQGSLPFLYNDFHGGLNTKDAAYLLTDNEARDLLNVQGTTAGAIVKRDGFTTFATPAAQPTSVFASEATASTFLVVAAGTSLYSVSSSAVIASIATTLTPGARWEFVSAPVVAGQGPVYGVNGVDTPRQWSGAGATVAWTNASGGVAVPNGKYCLYANNQVFVAGVAATPSRVFWSAIADPTNWDPSSLTGAGFADFDPNDGEAISAIGRVGPYILVSKPRKLWVLVDPATATIRRISDNVGCVAHRSIASGPEGTFFLAEDRGVYLTNGTKLTPVSDKIQPTIDSIAPGARANAAGTYFNGHYYLSVQLGASVNDTILDWDSTLQSWWMHGNSTIGRSTPTFVGSNQFAVWHPTGFAELFSAKAAALTGPTYYIDQCFVPQATQDNGVSFQWIWRGPWQSPTFYRRRRFPTPYFRKRLRQVRLDGEGTVDFSLAKDFATLETLVATDVFGAMGADTFGGGGTYGAADGSDWGDIGVGRKKIFGQGVANAFSLVFSATSGTPDQLFSYVLMMTDRRDLVAS